MKMTYLATMLALLTLGFSSLAHGDVTLVAEDFDGTTVGPGLAVSNGLLVTNVADPLDATNTVGQIDVTGGGQWQSLVQQTDYPLPAGTVANVDSIIYKYRLYIPTPDANSSVTSGIDNASSDSINSIVRVNGTAPDAYPPSQRNWTNDAFPFDQWFDVEHGGLIPEFNNLGNNDPGGPGPDPTDPTTSFTPILSFQIKGNTTPDTITSGLFGYIDDIEIGVTGTTPAGGGCDFNADLQCDSADIDLLYANFGGALSFDVDGSGLVDGGDIGAWLTEASDPANPYLGGTKTFVIGDVDLDGDVDSTDLGQMLNNFGDTSGLPFSAGNMNDDQNIDSSDLGLLLNQFGAMSAAGAAVPEPGTLPLLLIAALGMVGIGRRR